MWIFILTVSWILAILLNIIFIHNTISPPGSRWEVFLRFCIRCRIQWKVQRIPGLKQCLVFHQTVALAHSCNPHLCSLDLYLIASKKEKLLFKGKLQLGVKN